MKRALRLLAVVSGLTLALVGTMAVAAWLSSGSGAASVTAASLAAPTAVVGSATAGTGQVHVSWTASIGVPAPTGYYVLRQPTSGPAVPACATSQSTLESGTSCNDTGVPVGSFAYVVVAVFHSWTTASAASANVVVGRAAQTVTITSTPTTPTYGGTYHLTATGGASGSPIVFGTSTPGVCTVSSSLVTFVHAGPCTLTADQAGSTYYDAAAQATQTFSVARAAQAVAFTTSAPTGAVVGGTGYTPAATGGASGNPVTFSIDATAGAVCLISGGVVTYQHVGTCVVDADQAGNGDYLAANRVQQSIAVDKGAQGINFTSAPPSNPRIGDSYTVSASGGGSGNPVTFTTADASVCTVSTSTVTMVGVGTCTIRANQAGSADYLAATQVQMTFQVAKKVQSISFGSAPPANAQVGGATYTPTATSDSGLKVDLAVDASSSSVCTMTGGVVSFKGIGTCTIDADQAGDATYAAASQQQSITVAAVAKPVLTSCSRPAGNNKAYSLRWTWGPSNPDQGFTLSYTNLSSGSISPSTFLAGDRSASTPTINGVTSGTFELVALVDGVASAPATASFSVNASNQGTCTIN